jgi:hypothetical protein
MKEIKFYYKEKNKKKINFFIYYKMLKKEQKQIKNILHQIILLKKCFHYQIFLIINLMKKKN